MPRIHDERIRARGTRFRLYPQTPVLEVHRLRGPETVWVSPPPGSIGPGPNDERMYVADVIGKKPYEYPYLPPYRGPTHPAVRPGPDGHFDYLEPGDPGFLAAHMYGTVRRVLDVWEGFLGRPIAWHFRDRYQRLGEYECEVYPGAHRLLDELRAAGLRLATATSKGVEPTLRMLDHFELAHHFDFVGAASMDEWIIRRLTGDGIRKLAGL